MEKVTAQYPVNSKIVVVEQVISKNTKQRGIKKQGDKNNCHEFTQGQRFKGESQRTN